jgi:hypothetical protein
MPTVEYKKVKSPIDMKGMADAYFLQHSRLELSLTESSQEGSGDAPAVKTPVLTFKSTPVEDASRKLAISPNKNWQGVTTLSLVKHANSDLVSSLGVEVTNDVIANIGELGAIIVKGVPLLSLMGAAAETERPCLASNGTALKYDANLSDKSGASETFVIQGNAREPAKDCVRILVDRIPPDAMPYDELPTLASTDSFYYAACRKVSIRVEHRGQTLQVEGRISDPRFVQAVKFPAKGALTMHSQCGVSVTSEKAANQTTASAIVEALATQGKAIKDAIDAAKK